MSMFIANDKNLIGIQNRNPLQIIQLWLIWVINPISEWKGPSGDFLQE